MEYELVTHTGWDFDNAFSIWLLRREGEEKYPGIGQSKIVFFNGNLIKTPNRIHIDCGEIDYDHHPTFKFPEDCSATLIAKDLGLLENPYYSKLLTAVKQEDLHGGAPFLLLPKLIKSVQQLNPNNPQKVYDWVAEAFEAEFNSQLDFRFAEHAVSDFSKTDVLSGDLIYSIYSGITESESFGKWTRYKGAALTLQFHNSGQCQIYTNLRILRGRAMPILEDIISMLRVEEVWAQRQQGRKMPEDHNHSALWQTGSIAEAPEWYLDPLTKAIFNGSLKYPDVPATEIPRVKIQNLAEVALNTELPDPRCRQDLACRKNGCPYFYYFLHRCRKLRYDKLHKNSSPVPPTG
ncbi:MAG: hypothetical protein ABIG40_00515 [Parcubacteria group bacterium]